jgi:hypothetical protein
MARYEARIGTLRPISSKDRLLNVLAGERTDLPPVVFHSWGDYKVEFAGFHPKFQRYVSDRELMGIERAFYERFRPDWMHLGSAPQRRFWARSRRVEGNRAFIRSRDGTQWIEIQDDYSLAADSSDTPSSGGRPPFSLESKAAIDDYYAAFVSTEDDILKSGRFNHMKYLADMYGDRVLIAINDGLNGWIPGYSFEDSLVACIEKPDLAAYTVFKICERFLTDVRAAKAAGAHAYIFSEGYGGSLCLLSPELEERVEGDAKRWFYSEVRKIGLLPIGYWLGDVRPNMRLINSLDMAGLMIEEDKKGFTLDPVEIRRMLRTEICLFGNVDSALLLRGMPDAIRSAVRRQLKAAAEGPFVLANGSPIVIGTPPENLDAYMQEARQGGRR